MTTKNTTDVAVMFDRIRENITRSFEYRQAALADIVSVHKKRLWKQLGYSSFEECLEVELDINRFPMEKKDRWEAVAYLNAAGLSVRSISASVGMPKSTVQDDISRVRNRTGAYRGERSRNAGNGNGRKLGLDGKSYASRRRREPDCLTPKAITARDAANDLGSFAQKVGKQLAALKYEDLTHLTYEELQMFSDNIYRARNGLRNIQAVLAK